MEIKSDIDISGEDDKIFQSVCESGYFHIAMWLLKIKPDIDISANNDHAFRYSIRNRHLELAQWLFIINPNINIYSNNHFAFETACSYHYVDIASWLVDLRPNMYYIETEGDEIIDYGIYNNLNIVESKKIENITECNICLDTKSNCITDCNHQFCTNCLGTWYKRKISCPFCRNNILDVYSI